MDPGSVEVHEKMSLEPEPAVSSGGGVAAAPRLRIAAIDAFRGFAILLMVLANYIAGVAWIPAWLKHAPDIGLTVIDLIAPLFIFAIGLTFGLSIRRRASAAGWGKATGHALVRYLALIGIGAVLSAGEVSVGQSPGGVQWGVLQAIGAAGLIALALIRLPAWARAAAGLALLGGYQALLDHGWLQSVLQSPHGGLQGVLGWAAMLILATALADLFFRPAHGKPWLAAASGLGLALGLAAALLWPISKNRVSPSYVLVSLGASGLVFTAFGLFVDRFRLRLPLLMAWGKNPMLLYLLHELLLGLCVLPGVPGWYAQAPGWLVGLQALGLLAGLSAVAWVLERKQITFSL